MSAPARRAHLLEVASRIVATRGLDALRLDALAEAAGVSRPVVYEHFAGREQLLRALIDQYGALLQRRLATALAIAGPEFEPSLRASTQAYFDCVEEQGAALRVLLSSTGSTPAIETARANVRRRAIAQWISLCKRYTGLPRAEATAVVGASVAAAWSLVGRWLAGEIGRKRAEELHVSMTLAAVRELRTRSRAGPGRNSD